MKYYFEVWNIQYLLLCLIDNYHWYQSSQFVTPEAKTRCDVRKTILQILHTCKQQELGWKQGFQYTPQ